MRKYIFGIMILAGVIACGPKASEVPPPVTKEAMLEQAWDDFRAFNFQSAKSKFETITNLDPYDPEGYYGLGLSYMSLGLRDPAASSGIIAIFVEGSPYVNEIHVDTVTATLTDTIVTQCQRRYDPPRRIICEGYYIYHLSKFSNQMIKPELFNINKVPIRLLDFGQNFVVAEFVHTVLMTNPDSILSSTLPHNGDTVLYSAEVVSADSVNIFVWNSMAMVQNAYYLMENYPASIQYGYLAKLITPYGTLPSRVPVSYDPVKVKIQLAHAFYRQSYWYSLANVLHEIDNAWPYPGWGTDLREDIRWSLNNIDEIKSKYYSVVGGP